MPPSREVGASRNAVYRFDDRLSADERSVLELALAGVPNKTVAQRLGISMRTVERRRAAALRGLGADTLVEAARLLARPGVTPKGSFDAVLAVAAPTAVFDRERLVAVNAALCNAFRLTATELVGRPFTDLTHPAERAEQAEVLGQMFAGELDCYRAERRLALPGGPLAVLFVVVAMRGDDGTVRFGLAQVLRCDGT